MIFLYSITGCTGDPLDEENPLPETPSEKTLYLYRVPEDATKPAVYGDVYADGTSIIKIAVEIDKNAKKEYRKVTFTSSNGEFIGEKDDKREIEIEEDGKIVVEWKVPDTPGKSFIFASIGQGEGITPIKKELSIDIKDIAKAIDFSANRATLMNIPANNKETITFTAKIDPKLPEKYRTLVFECSDGSFVENGGKSGEKTVENGETSIIWKVGTTEGKKYISATIKGVPTSKNIKEIELATAMPSFTMTIPNKNEAIADGVFKFEIRISGGVNIPNNKVKISKNSGELVNIAGAPLANDELVLSNGSGVAFLKIGQTVEDYLIMAENNLPPETILPKRAYANDEIFISTTAENGEVKIIAQLGRDKGKVSIGTPVMFRAYQIIDNAEKDLDPGVFLYAKKPLTDASEKVEVTFKANSGIDTSKAIFITASSPKDDNEFASKSYTIKSKPRQLP